MLGAIIGSILDHKIVPMLPKTEGLAEKKDTKTQEEKPIPTEGKTNFSEELKTYASKECFNYEFKAYQSLWDKAYAWYETYKDNAAAINAAIKALDLPEATTRIQFTLGKAKELEAEINRVKPLIDIKVSNAASKLLPNNNKLELILKQGYDPFQRLEYWKVINDQWVTLVKGLLGKDGLESAIRSRLAEFRNQDSVH